MKDAKECSGRVHHRRSSYVEADDSSDSSDNEYRPTTKKRKTEKIEELIEDVASIKET